MVIESVSSLDEGLRLQPPPFPPGFQVVVSEALIWCHCGPHPISHAQFLVLESLLQYLVVQTI